MAWREPSPLAKGMAASVSLCVFIGLVVQAQWGCDSAEPEPGVADVPAEPSRSAEVVSEPAAAVTPNAVPPALAVEVAEPEPAVEPAANAKPESVDHRRGHTGQGGKGRNRRYLSSTKSDPDMFGKGGLLELRRSLANESAAEPQAQ